MVKVYSTPTCPWCVKAKEFLKKHKVKFKELNVAANKSAREELIEKSGQMGVPVIDVDGKLIIGFDEKELKKALKLK
ncbi:MAG: glutaredoxin domain-containing protein [Candidatus Woesearchaeota archaeon]|nr:glutaredoxin domain-containing protein [Candidatus Woesearchaeota archaeon]